MLNDYEIEQKYQIVYIGKQRYYKEDLSQRDYTLECTVPCSLDVKGKSFVESSWKQLLINVSSAFLNDNPEKRDELLNYRMAWNNKYAFFAEPSKNAVQVGNDIYLLYNFTALHACWLLQDILAIFGVDPKQCVFVIHRPPHSEPQECRIFYETKTRNAFKYYYVQLLKKPQERAEKVLKNIDVLNKYLSQCSLAYDNLYLIDNNTTFTNYRIKLIDFMRREKHVDENTLVVAKKYLDILGDFYKTIY